MAINEEALRKTIAENIVFYRKRSGDTQQALAEKLQYSDKSVSKWERGESTPDIVVLASMAELYGLRVEDFLRAEKVPDKKRSHTLAVLLSLGLVWLIFLSLFVAAQITGILAASAWVLFAYSFFVCSILCVIFSMCWGSRLARILSVSALIWSAGASLVFSFGSRYVPLLLLCAVLQLLFLLWFLLSRKNGGRR